MLPVPTTTEKSWKASPLLTARFLSKRQGIPYDYAPHLSYVSNAIVEAVDGRGPNGLIVSMPPQHGKTELVSRRTPEWYLANNPSKKVMVCSYADFRAVDIGRDVRNDCEFHSEVLGFGIAEDSGAKDMWHTTKGGYFRSAGRHAGITGKGADLMIIDDPVKDAQEAYSLTFRDDVWSWWLSSAQSRLQPNAVIIVVMTRWHSDDLVGRLLSSKYGDPTAWREISMPAVWEEDEAAQIDLGDNEIWRREKGTALWPARYDTPVFESRRRQGLDEETWQAMYQQRPLNTTGIGAVYTSFSEAVNVIDRERDDRLRIAWSLDFNIDPMSSVIAQVREVRSETSPLTGEKLIEIDVLDEIVIPNSYTLQACQEFDDRLKMICRRAKTSCDHCPYCRSLDQTYGKPCTGCGETIPGKGTVADDSGRIPVIDVYGDAAGNHRSHAGPGQSDWEIVFRYLKDHGYTFRSHVTPADPSIRDRVNAVNRALKSSAGISSLRIDPRCKQLIIDLKEVRWKRDASGNTTSQLDKKDPARTHISDALGYLIFGKFSQKGSVGEQSGYAG